MEIEEKIIWHNISTQNEADEFMKSVCRFHDSCLKEFKYLSGAYVEENLSMLPINTERTLRVIIQRQFKENSMIELKFTGLKKLILAPDDENYTCEIFGSELFFKDNLIWWIDGSIEEEESSRRFIVSASNLQWREIEGHMGKSEFYVVGDEESYPVSHNGD